ncbi:MAG: TonB-dependent receptor [Bacteroidetes bacterium]|nr:TonB-dependent receptor [Bacteroidota bacterium]
MIKASTLFLLLSVCSVCPLILLAHEASLTGTISNAYNHAPARGVKVALKGTELATATDSVGVYRFPDIPARNYTVIFEKEGYFKTEREVDLKENSVKTLNISLTPEMIELQTAQVASARATSASSSALISAIDMELRPRNSSQDLLKSVPGIFTAQHQGGAKAEQIFIRGYDCDHGTDINLSMDGVPINLPSHAHGQGYADMHFLIADVVSALDVYKGPFQAQFGDFYTGGAVAFRTYDTLPHSQVRLEFGTTPTQRAFATSRLLFALNIPTKLSRLQSYLAAEYSYSPGYFDVNAKYSKFNIFGKMKYKLSDNTSLALSVASYAASWTGSGQIPERAVEQGIIDRFGGIDPTEGGSTDRTVVNLMLNHHTDDSRFLLNMYYQRYGLTLYNDFTFFLNDPVHGDEIEQDDDRNVFGFNTQYSKFYDLGSLHTKSTFGGGVRTDVIHTDLWHVQKRVRLDERGDDNLSTTNANLWFKQDFNVAKWFRFDAAVRMDYSVFQDRDNHPDSAYNRSGTNYQMLPTYKLNFVFTPVSYVQLFINNGMGYHSNDTRAVVQDTRHWLPMVFSSEVGATVRVGTRAIITTSLYLQDASDELVFSSDEATTEDNGSSRRMGIDLSGRLQIARWLLADLDVNYSHNRLTDKFLGRQSATDYYVPLAPSFTSQGGLTVRHKSGFKARLGYRAMLDRPANENNSIIAKGYYVMDAMVAFERKRYQVSLTVENLLNTKWNEAQFATITRLTNEAQAVDQLCFTSGTAVALKFGVSYFFR